MRCWRSQLSVGRCSAGLGDLAPRLEKEANKDSKVLHLRLAGALVALGRIEEAAAALKTLDALIVRRGTLMPAADRAALESTRDFIRAKWWLLQRDLASALPLLKRVVNQGTEATNTPQSYEAWSFLGQIWEAGDEWDQAAAAYEQASLLKPQSADYNCRRQGLGQRRPLRHGDSVWRTSLGDQARRPNMAHPGDTHYRQQIHRPKSQRDGSPSAGPLRKPWRLPRRSRYRSRGG